MEFPKTKGEIFLWIIGLIGLYVIAPFVKEMVGEAAKRIIKSIFPEKKIDGNPPEPPVTPKAPQKVSISQTTFDELLKYRGILKNYEFLLRNFRIINYDDSLMPDLILQRERLLELHSTFENIKDQKSSLDNNTIFAKRKAHAEFAINSFSTFTQSNILKLQYLFCNYIIANDFNSYHWLTNIAPLYRRYLTEQIFHIKETYLALKPIEEFFEQVEIQPSWDSR